MRKKYHTEEERREAARAKGRRQYQAHKDKYLERQRSPESKERQKERRKSPEWKAKDKQRRQQPEVKRRMLEASKKYRAENREIMASKARAKARRARATPEGREAARSSGRRFLQSEKGQEWRRRNYVRQCEVRFIQSRGLDPAIDREVLKCLMAEAKALRELTRGLNSLRSAVKEMGG